MEMMEMATRNKGYESVPNADSSTATSQQIKTTSSRLNAFICFVVSVAVCYIAYTYYVSRTSISNTIHIYQTSYAGDKLSLLDVNMLKDRGFDVSKLQFNNERSKGSSSSSSTSSSRKNPTAYVHIHQSRMYQTIIGFGGAFTEASAINFYKLPKNIQDKIISLYFGVDSIGYTLGRVHINSCDFSPASYSFDSIPNDFDLLYFDTEVTHDNSQMLPFMRLAKAAVEMNNKELKIIAAPWSPPEWMKVPDKETGKQSMTGSNQPNGLILSEDVQRSWALYISKFITSYYYKGVPIWAVTPQNEPEFAAPWEACSYNASTELEFINSYLGPALEYNNPDVLILGFDHNKDHLLAWSKELIGGSKKDRKGGDYIDGMAFHWYAGENDRMLDGTYGYNALNATHHYAPDKILLATEGCSCPDVKLNDWLRAERLSHDIIYDVLNYAQGWIDWNLIVDHLGGPNHLNNMCDASIIASSDFSSIHLQPKYYFMGHISKFLTPGSIRVDTSVVGDFKFVDIDPNVRIGIEVGAYMCEKSVRQSWVINTTGNKTIGLTKGALSDQNNTLSAVRLCLGEGTVDRPYVRLVDCDIADTAHRQYQFYHNELAQFVELSSNQCLSLADDVVANGALFNMKACVSDSLSQKFIVDNNTGEIKPLPSTDLCLTAGWPMLYGVAVIDRSSGDGSSNDVVSVVIMNEAEVDVEVTLSDSVNGVFATGINSKSIQTIAYTSSASR